MTEFFANDFSEDKWKKAALKNAFVLMGKQRFDHAVAFFLLGGALNDALQVGFRVTLGFRMIVAIGHLGDLSGRVHFTLYI